MFVCRQETLANWGMSLEWLNALHVLLFSAPCCLSLWGFPLIEPDHLGPLCTHVFCPADVDIFSEHAFTPGFFFHHPPVCFRRRGRHSACARPRVCVLCENENNVYQRDFPAISLLSAGISGKRKQFVLGVVIQCVSEYSRGQTFPSAD